MKTIHLKDTLGKLLLAFSLLCSIGIMSSLTAQAQYNRDGNSQGRRDGDYQRDRERRRREWEDRRNRNRNGRYNDGYPDLGGSFELRQTALNAGANEGNKEGRKDRSRGERYEFRDESAYQKGTKDYSSKLGDKEIYRRYFREAFEHGYADGYDGY